jgi:cytidylate kinase
MGTVVFPDAQLKFFLTASPEVRAERRYLQLKEKDASVTLPALVDEIRERDYRDEHRSASPMRPASDAVTIDTSQLDINQVVKEVLTRVSEVFLDI